MSEHKDSFPFYLSLTIISAAFAIAAISVWLSHNDDKMFLFSLSYIVLAILAGDGMIKTAREQDRKSSA